MNDSIPDPGAGAYIEIAVRIPDELARRHLLTERRTQPAPTGHRRTSAVKP